VSYEVIRYRPELAAETAALHAQLFGLGTEASAAYLRWKYEQNPYLDAPLLYLALADGVVVGMRGAYGTGWRLDGERCVLPCFGDTIVDPEHRNRGLFPRIMRFALRDLERRGHAYAINQSAEPITVLSSLATGWRAFGPPVLMRRRSRIEHTSRRRRSGFPVRTARRVRRRLRPGRSVFERLDRTGPGLPAPADLARLLDGPGPDGRLRHVRDAEYLSWRLADPVAEHRVVVAQSGSDVTACLVLKTMRGNGRAVIADWAAETPEALAAVIEKTLRRARFADVAFWSGSLDDATRDALHRIGFYDVDHGMRVSLLLRATDDRPAGDGWRLGGVDLLAPAAWELRLIHSEREFV